LANAAAAAAGRAAVPARDAPQRACVGRHLANRNEMRVSGCEYMYVAVFVSDGVMNYGCLLVSPPGRPGLTSWDRVNTTTNAVLVAAVKFGKPLTSDRLRSLGRGSGRGMHVNV